MKSYLGLPLLTLATILVASCTTINAVEFQKFETISTTNSTTDDHVNSVFLTYHLSDMKMNWADARYLCASQGMNLLSIPNLSADNTVKAFLSDTGSFAAWTAGSDKSGSFKWETSGSSIGYFNWRHGSVPVGPPGCISVSNTGACDRDGDYGWDKDACDMLRYAICQF